MALEKPRQRTVEPLASIDSLWTWLLGYLGEKLFAEIMIPQFLKLYRLVTGGLNSVAPLLLILGLMIFAVLFKLDKRERDDVDQAYAQLYSSLVRSLTL